MKLGPFFTKLKKLSRTRAIALFLLGLFSTTPILAAVHEVQHSISHARASSEPGYSTEEFCSLCLVAVDTRQIVASSDFVVRVDFSSAFGAFKQQITLLSLAREVPRSRGPPA